MKRYKDWTKKDLPKPANLKVFGTFVCGGGSTMGYKLAGFKHLGGVEIDKSMAELYTKNLNPKYMYLEDIRQFNEREDLPEELYNLDILDGSPPCTTFSMAGKREEVWGTKKVFREGQASQTLDDLLYVYCDTIKKLSPKVAILENVPGIVVGRAKKYTIGIVERLNASGYEVQVFLLNSATMGVPQSRERVFFIARRRDLGFSSLVLDFSEKPICFAEIRDEAPQSKELIPSLKARLPFLRYGERNFSAADQRYRNKPEAHAFFNSVVIYDSIVPGTLTSSGNSFYFEEQRNLTNTEYCRMSTFPTDYDFCGKNVRYVCGMSVPPLMMRAIASEIRRQWFKV